MLKKTQKTLAMFILMFVFLSTVCLATDDTPVATSEEPDANVVAEGNTTPEGDEDVSGTDAEEEEYEDDLYEDDLYSFSNDISVTQLVDGNAYLFGQNVSISGQIGGDLFVIADNLTIEENSQVYGNLYVCANSITIRGMVCDLYAACGSITIEESGIVIRDLRTVSGDFNFNGSVGRNTYITTNNITLGEATHIYGDFNYSSPEAVQVPSDAVEGTINYTEAISNVDEGTSVLSYVIDAVYAVVYTVIVFAVFVFLAPNFLRKIGDVVAHKSLVSFGIGIAALVATVPIAFLLILSFVATPVAFALLAVWAFILFGLSSALTAIALASFIGSKISILGKAHNLPAVILVSLVLWGLLQVPFYVGSIVQLLVWIFGSGYLFVTAFQNRKKEEV